MAVGVILKTRRGTAAEWAAANPILAAGEQGYETNTGVLKLGDGVTAYNSLSKFNTPRVTTLVIAASDSSAKGRAQADYVCDGTNDNVEILAAITALPSIGGKIQLLEGSYTFGATLTSNKDNVTISGTGFNTYIKYNASNYAISFGTTKNNILENCRLDVGGVDVTLSSKWVLSNVWRDNPVSASTDPILIDHWSADHIAPRSNDSFIFQTFKHPLVQLVDGFELDDWTATTCTLTYDTTIKYSKTRSAKVVTDVGVAGKIDKAITLDLTDMAIGVMVYTPDCTKIDKIGFYAKTTLSPWTHYIYDVEINYYTINDHWIMIVFPRLNQAIGSPDLSQVNLIRLQVFPVAGQVATVYFDKIITWKRSVLAKKGIVTFTFDDGMPNVVTKGKPLFDVYNWSGVFSQVISRMNSTQIENARYMQSDGWDIVSHSYDHDLNKSLYDPAWQYLLSQKWLADNGFESGSKFALMNNGANNKQMIKLLNENLCFARSSTVGYNALPCLGTTVTSQCIRQTTTLATIQGWIDQAKTYGLWLVLMFHDIKDATTTEYDCSVSMLADVLSYCNSQGVEVLTFSQIVERIKNQKLETTGSGKITSGNTSVNVRHGFHKVPASIQITQTSGLGTAASIWVSSKDVGSTGTLFTVSINASVGQDVTFDWRAIL